MRFPRNCPRCGASDTEPVHTEFATDVIERVRVCKECPTEYSITYGNPTLREVRDGDGDVVPLSEVEQ